MAIKKSVVKAPGQSSVIGSSVNPGGTSGTSASTGSTTTKAPGQSLVTGSSVSPTGTGGNTTPVRRSGGGGSSGSQSTSTNQEAVQSDLGLISTATNQAQVSATIDHARQQAIIDAQVRNRGFSGRVDVSQTGIPQQQVYYVGNQKTATVNYNPKRQGKTNVYDVSPSNTTLDVNKPSTFEFRKTDGNTTTSEGVQFTKEGYSSASITQVTTLPTQPLEVDSKDVNALQETPFGYVGTTSYQNENTGQFLSRKAKELFLFVSPKFQLSDTTINKNLILSEFGEFSSSIPDRFAYAESKHPLFTQPAVQFAILGAGATPEAIYGKELFSEGAVGFSLQRQVDGKVETYLGAESTNLNQAVLLKATSTKGEGGIIFTEVRGIAGKSGTSATVGQDFYAELLSRSGTSQGKNVLYQDELIKAYQEANAGGSASVGVLKYPSKAQHFENIRLNFPTGVKRGVNPTELVKFYGKSVTFGTEDAQLVFGATRQLKSSPEGYFGVNFKLPTEPEVNIITGTNGGSKALKTYHIVDEQLYKQSLNDALATATKSLSKPSVPIKPIKLKTTLLSALDSQRSYTPSPSAYTGTGLYERTDGGLSPLGLSKGNLNLKLDTYGYLNQKFNFNLNSLNVQDQKTSNKSRNNFISRFSFNQDSALRQNSILDSLFNQKSQQKQNQKQTQRLKQKQNQRNVNLNLNVKIPINPKFPIFKLNLGSGKSNSRRGRYSVSVRRNKQFKTIGRNLSKNFAFSLGEYATQTGLSQSFKIGGGKNLGTPKGYYSKREKKNGLVFIELPGSKINTRSEKGLLSLSRMMKGGLK